MKTKLLGKLGYSDAAAEGEPGVAKPDGNVEPGPLMGASGIAGGKLGSSDAVLRVNHKETPRNHCDILLKCL